jgi:hypothetical protein
MAKALSALTDAELISVANQTYTAMNATPAGYGTTAPEIANLLTVINDALAAMTTQLSLAAETKAATTTKEEKVALLLDALRARLDVAKAHGTSEAMMHATSIPSGSTPVPANATVPIGTVDTSQRLKHSIGWVEATTPDNKKRPRGSMGAEIWHKVDGPPPIDVSECSFVAIDSASPHMVDYTGDDAGKMVHYMLRWKMRDGDTLAFGETLSATVTG